MGLEGLKSRCWRLLSPSSILCGLTHSNNILNCQTQWSFYTPYSSRPVVTTEGWGRPQEPLSNAQGHFSLSHWRVEGYWHLVGRGQDATKHQCTGQVPVRESDLAPNVSGAEASLLPTRGVAPFSASPFVGFLSQ